MELKARHRRAIRLLANGTSPTQVAKMVKVSRATIFNWKKDQAFREALDIEALGGLDEVDFFSDLTDVSAEEYFSEMRRRMRVLQTLAVKVLLSALIGIDVTSQQRSVAKHILAVALRSTDNELRSWLKSVLEDDSA